MIGMTDQDRIKLAEAMNLLPDDFQGWGEYKDAIEKYDGEVLRILLALIPDPFTDANHDYTVLVWMQNYQGNAKKLERWFRFCNALREICNPPHMSEYEVGYYAKAALKAIYTHSDQPEQETK